MDNLPAQSPLLGVTIGNYRVASKIGEGGMGIVYLAEHPLIGKKVAIKVLHDDLTGSREAVRRFFTEAKSVNDIGHPNIVDILDYGAGSLETGEGFIYLTMEYLSGESLLSLLAREGPLLPDRATRIVLQAADALSASHQKGIVHRDLKPDNIFLVPRGREKEIVKLLDFGIAKLLGADFGDGTRTRTGVVLGTPGYMSPEQCAGRKDIDHRSDIYSLGVVLYQMLTGRVPYEGEDYGEVLVKQMTMPLSRPSHESPGVPLFLESVVLKSLERRREDRFQTMEKFAAALRGQGEAVSTVPPALPRAPSGPAMPELAGMPTARNTEAHGPISGAAMRLESAMLERRRWTMTSFRESVVNHPLLRKHAAELVWGIYDAQNRLSLEFHVMENGRFADRGDTVVVLKSDVQIGLPHPMELAAANLQEWEDLLSSYGITQPFAQLRRPMFHPTPDEQGHSILWRVDQVKIATGKVLMLDRHGWQPGPPADGGLIRSYEKNLPGGEHHAVLALEPGYYPAALAKHLEQRLGLVLLEATRGAKSQRAITCGELDRVAFSELVLDLASLKG
jgi:serine/threonine protein kinase